MGSGADDGLYIPGRVRRAGWRARPSKWSWPGWRRLGEQRAGNLHRFPRQCVPGWPVAHLVIRAEKRVASGGRGRPQLRTHGAHIRALGHFAQSGGSFEARIKLNWRAWSLAGVLADRPGHLDHGLARLRWWTCWRISATRRCSQSVSCRRAAMRCTVRMVIGLGHRLGRTRWPGWPTACRSAPRRRIPDGAPRISAPRGLGARSNRITAACSCC